jgi:hypothetical protein
VSVIEAEPPGCVHHPISDLNCRHCALMRSEYYAALASEPPPPWPPTGGPLTSWYRQQADNPPTEEELDAWVRGEGKADRL